MTILNSKVTILLYDYYKKNTLNGLERQNFNCVKTLCISNFTLKYDIFKIILNKILFQNLSMVVLLRGQICFVSSFHQNYSHHMYSDLWLVRMSCTVLSLVVINRHSVLIGYKTTFICIPHLAHQLAEEIQPFSFVFC